MSFDVLQTKILSNLIKEVNYRMFYYKNFSTKIFNQYIITTISQKNKLMRVKTNEIKINRVIPLRN